MAGEKAFIESFVANSRYITSAKENGVFIHRGVSPDVGPGYRYVDTGFGERENSGILYTDSITWCSGLALWSNRKAGLIHIVPGPESFSVQEIKNFLVFYDNSVAAIPQQVTIATLPQCAPPYQNDADASEKSLYKAARALYEHYGAGIAPVTMIITGFRGRQWSSRARLSVSAQYGVSIAIP